MLLRYGGCQHGPGLVLAVVPQPVNHLACMGAASSWGLVQLW